MTIRPTDDPVIRAHTALRAWQRSDESGSPAQRGRDAATLQTQIGLCCCALAESGDNAEKLAPFFEALGALAAQKLAGMTGNVDRAVVMDLLLVLEPWPEFLLGRGRADLDRLGLAVLGRRRILLDRMEEDVGLRAEKQRMLGRTLDSSGDAAGRILCENGDRMGEKLRRALTELIGPVDPDSQWGWAERVLTAPGTKIARCWGAEALLANDNRLLLAALVFFGWARAPGNRGWPVVLQKALPFLSDDQAAELARKIPWVAAQPGYRESLDRDRLRGEAGRAGPARERLL